MSREQYLGYAREGLCMPVGTDMVLHMHSDAKAILRDSVRLGEVLAQAARRFSTPLAIPVMDLTIEKNIALEILGVPECEREKFHFSEPLDGRQMQRLEEGLRNIGDCRLLASAGALSYVAANYPDMVPVGMGIGPFSLLTKLVADPITAVYLAGTGATAEEDEEVALIESMLDLATRTILASLKIQIAAGARAIFLCEPAANTVYLSPNHTGPETETFEKFVMGPNRLIAELLEENGIDLLFHDCGELTPEFIRAFAGLRPAVLSFGSPVKLWEAAEIVPDDIVLFGNLPSKKFFSDEDMPVGKLEALTLDLLERMRATKHPFILATECDVLSVPGREEIIFGKIEAFMRAARAAEVGL